MFECRLLGSVAVRLDGRSVDLGPAKQRCVLAVLLVEANRAVPVDRLIDRVWADHPPLRVRSSLHSYLTGLRRALKSAPVSIAGQSGTYVLTVDEHAIDLHRFRHLLGQSRAETDDERALALAEQALGLWRGEPFAGLDTPWLASVRAELEQEQIAAQLDRVEVALRCGRHTQLLPALSALAGENPLDERVAAQFMLALHRSGRQADALDEYQRVRRHLADELGVDPGPDLQRLHESLLRNDIPLHGDRPHPDTVVPRQLPADIPAFAGRAADLATLDALAEASTVVISAIHGTAGIGKTALAIRWGYHTRDRFPDGQLHINLRGFDSDQPPMDPAEALAQFLRALGIDQRRIPYDVQERAALFRSTMVGKRMLVLLDNAASEEQVRPMLPGMSPSVVVVTSRHHLTGLIAADGARSLPLDVLTPAEARSLLENILGQPRVAAEPTATAELAHCCGYLPLALRVAAGKLVMRPEQQIADAVTELRTCTGLDALEVTGDRRAAVAAAFDLSYLALKPEEQLLFRRLGLVPGPDFTAEAAAALADCTPTHAKDILDRLVTASLVDRRTVGRYVLHALLRAYAQIHASHDDERESATCRLFDWYLRAAVAASTTLYPHEAPLAEHRSPPFCDRATALRFLDAERENFVSAILHAAKRGPKSTAWLLADVLRPYFSRRMLIRDGLTVADCAASAAASAGASVGQAVAEIIRVRMYTLKGDNDAAARHVPSALSLCRTAGWAVGEFRALTSAGLLAYYCGRLAEAEQYFRDAQRASVNSGHAGGETVYEANLGLVHMAAGRPHQALALFTKILRTARSTYTTNEAIALTGVGRIHRVLGDLDSAEAFSTEALAMHREFGSRYGEVIAMVDLADTFREQGRLREAHSMASEALSFAQDNGDAEYELAALVALAAASHCLNDTQSAIQHYQRVIQRSSPSRYALHYTAAQIGLARALLDGDQAGEALTCAKIALNVSRASGFSHLADQASTIITAAIARP